MVKKTLSQVLIDKEFLTPEQVEQYQQASQAESKTLDEYIRVHNLLAETELAQAFAEQFNIPFFATITEKMADAELLAHIPLKFLREHTVMPVLHNRQVYIVTANPLLLEPIDELLLLLPNAHTAVATRVAIIDAINRYYPFEGTKQMIEELEEEEALGAELDLGAIEEEDILGMANEAPIIKLVNHILYQAVKQGASDIHIEPFEKELRVRYRIDGVMHEAFNPPKRIQSALVSRLKIMSNLNIAEKRVPQDGRIQVKIADKAIDIRVSILPVAYGERVVMRLLDKSRSFAGLSQLNLSERDFKIIKRSIEEPNGIILITGPTGSGKTSTLYSILNTLNGPDVNIITVEDPVEYQMSGISQVQVRENIGLTFAAALRSILRQDPDIVMIGETRDQETAQIAIQAALTGHLVLSTLHTNSAAATLTRLIDMGVEPFLIASTIISVTAQRLVRKLCDHCKQAYVPSDEIVSRLPISKIEAKKVTFYKAVGCPECLHTGYKGRLAIFEIMVMTPAISRLTIERADTTLIQEQAIKDGMTLLIQDGLRKIIAGLTTIEEVLAVASSAEGIEVE